MWEWGDSMANDPCCDSMDSLRIAGELLADVEGLCVLLHCVLDSDYTREATLSAVASDLGDRAVRLADVVVSNAFMWRK